MVALDGEGRAEGTLPVVTALARRSLAEVVLVSVRDAGTDPEAARIAARLAAEGVNARTETLPARDGSVADVIVEAARDWPADLVALGSHGRGDAAGLLLGSVGHRVASDVECPVLLVHDGRPEAWPRPIRRLLVAVDGSEGAQAAIETARCVALEHSAAILVVHAPRHDDPAGRRSASELLDAAALRLGRTGCTLEVLTGPGPVAARLAASAERWNADLVVLGSRRLTDLGGLLVGSVAHGLVKRTHRPVLLAAHVRPAGRPKRKPTA